MYFRDATIKTSKHFNVFPSKFTHFNIRLSCRKYGSYAWTSMESINVIHFHIADSNTWNACNHRCLAKTLKILSWWWSQTTKIKIHILGSNNSVFYYKLNSHSLNFKVIKRCSNSRTKMITIINSLFMGCG